jgi:hypothetical protein
MDTGAFPDENELADLDRIHRTNFIAGPAIGADIPVDHMNIFPLANCLDGTDVNTSTTVDTVVVDEMSTHFFPPRFLIGVAAFRSACKHSEPRELVQHPATDFSGTSDRPERQFPFLL